WLQTLDFVAFDTETTGLWAPANRIVEVGAVKFRLGQPRIEQFQALVNPERKIPAETIRIHGITDSMVRQSETIEPVIARFLEFCGTDSVLIAHNAMFDIGFVGCEADRVGIELPENLILDTVDICRKYRPGLDSYSLLALVREFKIDRSQNHRAADDAAQVWKLFEHLSQDFPFLDGEGEFRKLFTSYRFSQWQGEEVRLPDQFEEISRAIEQELPLEIMYASNGRPPQKRIIRPRRVHSLRAQYYIAAFCEQVEEERTFRLDRISSFRVMK
ncbi:MAG: WYL domain-containing protein, partial [bacterium]|nr:WYL domain-containing protein [bacterium]